MVKLNRMQIEIAIECYSNAIPTGCAGLRC
jgi:hypothetical protein